MLCVGRMSRASRAAVVALLLAGTPVSAQTDSSSSPQRDAAQEAVLEPFKGDWEEIKQRRMLRALVVYSRTLYFVDRGTQRGVTYEVLKAFEDDVNARLQTKDVPVPRDVRPGDARPAHPRAPGRTG